MSFRDFSGLVVVFVAGCLGTTFSFAADSGLEDPLAGSGESHVVTRDTPWTIDELAGNIGAFSHVSVAADGPPRSVYISYYDVANGDLMWARTVDSGGNCGPGNAWLCEALVTDGDVGLYNSIAVKPSGDGVNFIVAYYDATSEKLMAVDGYVTEGTLTTVVDVIHSGYIATDRAGMYTAVGYGLNGMPWIAYQNEEYDQQVGTIRMYARFVGDGAGNCGEGLFEGDWDCHMLFNRAPAQSFSSTGMAIDDEGRPVVAFYDDHLNYPVLAYYLGSGGNCGPSNRMWRCYEVPPQPGDSDTGKHVVPFVGDGSMTLFYQNSSRGVLEKATYVYPVSGNCGWSDDTTRYEWQCYTIDNMDGIFMERGISVAADAAGYPIVAYQYGFDPGPGGLGVARPVASPEVGSGAGNCGPGNSWYCQIIDVGATLREADSVSIAVSPRGEGIIAYEEVDDYPYPAVHNLKFATLSMSGIFFEDFESGDTSHWSNTVGGVGPFSITQSIDPITIAVGGTIGCSQAIPGSLQNQYLRRFHLAADHEITHPVTITSIDWAIGRVNLLDVGLPIATVNIYALANGAAFTYANMGAPIGTALIPLNGADAGTFVNCPVTGSIVDPVTTDLVVEFVLPDGTNPPDRWNASVGQNAGGEIRNSYIAAADCGWDEPTTFTSIGEDSEMIVLTVNGVAQAPLKATTVSDD